MAHHRAPHQPLGRDFDATTKFSVGQWVYHPDLLGRFTVEHIVPAGQMIAGHVRNETAYLLLSPTGKLVRHYFSESELRTRPAY